MPDVGRPLHIALTVRDMRRSADWYMHVLGFQFVKEFGPEEGIPRILLLHPGSGFLLGLVNHQDRTGAPFDHRHTGLDHLAFEVADENELKAWLAHLDEHSVAHSPIRDIGHSAFVSFEDVDGVQLEVWFTRVAHRASQVNRPSS